MRTMARCIVIAVLAVSIVAVAGCSSSGTPADKTAPTVSSLTTQPKTLAAVGGPVALSVRAADDTFVSGVVFTVTQGATSQQVLGTLQGGLYRATYEAPMNEATTRVTYTVSVRALDAAQNSSTALTGTFAVAGIMDPPPAPTN
jgi:hypothetical protein